MTRNLEMLQVVAAGLRSLREQVVFVGGATTALYADDPASPEVRPISARRTKPCIGSTSYMGIASCPDVGIHLTVQEASHWT
jgi:hypothetical protein